MENSQPACVGFSQADPGGRDTQQKGGGMGTILLWLFPLIGYTGLLFWIWGVGVYQKAGLSVFGFFVVFAFFAVVETKLNE